jgi:hypothetical protein
MKKILSILASWWLTSGFLVVLLTIILADVKITNRSEEYVAAGEKAWIGAAQAKAIANAIEQYCQDFPDVGPLGNTKEWTERLSGHNPKGIQYLKVKRFGPDSDGRLLDLCGQPWIIETADSPGFEHVNTPESPDEFHVRSANCPGFMTGRRNHPMYPRSY